MRKSTGPWLLRHSGKVIFALLALLLLLLGNNSIQSIAAARGALIVEPGPRRLANFCSLFSDDIVVEGVIESVKTEHILLVDWYGGIPPWLETSQPLPPDLGLDVLMVQLDIIEILKGKFGRHQLTFTVSGSELGRNYEVGDTVIVSCRYWEHRLGGSYSVRSDCGRFIRSRGVWVNQAGAGVFTTAEIRSMLREQSDVRYFAKDADVVALVRMGSLMPDTVIHGPQDSVYHVGRMKAPVERVLKGVVPDDTLSFRVGGGGDYWPTWREPAPRLHGGRWIVFLKRGPVGLYPMGGANGMLRIVGRRLILNNRVEHPYGVDSLEALVKREVKR